MWCDNFDLDLYKLVPEAREALAPVANVQLVTIGGKWMDGRLNHPSVWNGGKGMVAFFAFGDENTPIDQIKPEACWSNEQRVACTFEEAVRDCWLHNYEILVRMPNGTFRDVYETCSDEQRNALQDMMGHVRKYHPLSEAELQHCRSVILKQVQMAGGKLVILQWTLEHWAMGQA